jgi:hypothetical protein
MKRLKALLLIAVLCLDGRRVPPMPPSAGQAEIWPLQRTQYRPPTNNIDSVREAFIRVECTDADGQGVDIDGLSFYKRASEMSVYRISTDDLQRGVLG